MPTLHQEGNLTSIQPRHIASCTVTSQTKQLHDQFAVGADPSLRPHTANASHITHSGCMTRLELRVYTDGISYITQSSSLLLPGGRAPPAELDSFACGHDRSQAWHPQPCRQLCPGGGGGVRASSSRSPSCVTMMPYLHSQHHPLVHALQGGLIKPVAR